MPVGDVRVTPAEIGGGFGGKTVVYLEPVADAAVEEDRPPGQDHDEPRRGVQGHRPDLGLVDVGQDRRQEGRHDHRRRGRLQVPGRRLPGLAGDERAACAPSRPTTIENQHTVGYDVVCNRPKSAAYRAPGSPISAFAVESVIDMLAKKIGMDPLELRLKNAAEARHADDLRAKARPWRLYRDARGAASTIPAYKTPLGPNQGRGVASGYWFNGGGELSATRADQRRRHDHRRHRQRRYRRLARLDGADGGRDLRGRLQPGARDRRRHRLGRLHPCDRRLARHLRDRHGGRRRQQEGRSTNCAPAPR